VRWDGIGDIFVFETRGIVFYTHVDRDLVFDPVAGRNQLVGESNRFGAMGVVRTQVSEWLDLQTSLTWAEAYLPPANAGPFEWTAGPRLPYVPRLVSRTDVTVFHDFWIKRQPFDWSLSSGVSYVAPRPLPLDAFGTRYAVVDLGGRLRWRWVEVGVEIQNLLDQRYHQFELFYPSNFDGPAARPSMLPQLHFVAGPPLTAMGTLTLYFEPDARRRLRDRRLERGVDPETPR
jgi:outer membrane receptor protein involved in Fe transport